MQQAHRDGGHFTFYLLDGFTLHTFSAALEALRVANAVAGRTIYDWTVVTGDGHLSRSACGMRVAAGRSLAEEREQLHRPGANRVVVVCGGSGIPASNKALEAWLRQCRRHRIDLAGIAGGLYPLARAGLLDDRRCAVHWEHFPDFCERFSAAKARQTVFEVDKDIHTCAGGNASFDMIMSIIEGALGEDVTNRIFEISLCERRREAGERQRLPLQARLGIDNASLIRVVQQMEANLSEPLRLAEMTPASGLSRRQMERLFRREMGRTPARYYLDLRLERAHLLLVTSSLPVIEVAIACGFSTASHFSRAYRDRYGRTPQNARRAEAERRNNTGRPAAYTQNNVDEQHVA